jgi:hypothetical protein
MMMVSTWVKDARRGFSRADKGQGWDTWGRTNVASPQGPEEAEKNVGRQCQEGRYKTVTRSFPPSCRGRPVSNTPYPRDARYRRPAASPQ